MTDVASGSQRSGYMREVLNLLSINDAQLPSDIDRYWRVVAVAIGVQPVETTLDTAKAVLDAVGDWDDDYLTEDQSELSDEAYGDLLSALNEKTLNGTLAWTAQAQQSELFSEEDDTDSTSWDLGVGQETTPDVQTVLRMVFDNELVVNPEWQRNFVWPVKKQRRFIESILMGLPIPSLLLFADVDTGIRYVIDGRQRLETLARFCATPEQREMLDFLGKRFRTFSAKEQNWREGQDLHESSNKYFDQMPDRHRLKINQAPLTMFTFRSLAPRQLYQIFQRYNTGGEKLRAAEIRNAVYQASSLHLLLWRLAGESPDRIPYVDAEEEYVANTLRNIMQNKRARYGTYDFLGRVMAFTYLDNGKTVAAATNDFMDEFELEDHEALRLNFLKAFDKVLSWYTFPLSRPAQNGGFHGFLGTIQLVTAHRALQSIADGSLTEDQVVSAISKGWMAFAQDTLEMKQNSGTFWQRQKDWWYQIQSASIGEV